MIELGLSSVPPATEVRSGENSYTDLVLAGLLAQQGRGAEAAEWATGAVQSAAGLWARCLSVATSDLEAVTPEVLGAIGFDLAWSASTFRYCRLTEPGAWRCSVRQAGISRDVPTRVPGFTM